MEPLNRSAESISFFESLSWRVEAWRSGQDFAALAEGRSRIYRVEQLFLIHRGTNQWLLHLAADPEIARDAAGITAMWQEIQDLARRFFIMGDESGVEEFPVDERQVWIAPGPQAHLAAVIRGEAPRDLRVTLADAIQRVHNNHAAALANFAGDPAPFAVVAPELNACFRSAHRALPQIPRLPRWWRWVAVAAAVALIAGLLARRSEAHWQDFVRRLNAEPGLLVAHTERHWFGPSRVIGLRDARARDPAALAKEAGVNPAGVQFEWRDLEKKQKPVAVLDNKTKRTEASEAVPTPARADVPTARDDALEHFRAEFAPPATVSATVKNNTLILAGKAPYEWIAPVQEGATKIDGITAINGDNLVVEFDPRLLLQRFRERFTIPEKIDASVENGQLILAGEAPHAWLARVRREAMEVTGIRVLDDRKVTDIDQRDFRETKSVIESASISFGLNRETLEPEAIATLGRLAQETRRCFAAAQNLGVNVSLDLRGFGDGVGNERANTELSERRAQTVRDFLVKGGLPAEKIHSLGMGASPVTAAPEKTGSAPSEPRVFLRVVIQP
ncbi:MAG: OmpA family protein [Verrucomicrobiota bacterium]|nr:OmpA family protein [Verrucomicrobiota bacterium]